MEVEISEDMQVVHFDFNRSEYQTNAYFDLSFVDPRHFCLQMIE